MPAYFSMTIQRKSKELTHNYVESIYTAIIESGYPFKSGFWFHQDATYNEIVAWNQTKLEQGFQLGFTEHGSNGYMQILFDSPEYKQMRGFWMYNETDIAFNLIIPEHDILNYEGGDTVLENKISPIRKMGIHLWEKGLSDIIQTSVELDAGYYCIDEVLCGKNVMAHPFAIIPQEAIVRFQENYFANNELVNIGNDGVLINSDNKLPAFFQIE